MNDLGREQRNNIALPRQCVPLLMYQRAAYRSKPYKAIRWLPLGKQVYLRYMSRLEWLRRRRIEEAYSLEMNEVLSTFDRLLPTQPKRVLDVGAGMAGIDAALYKRCGDGSLELWLLDKRGVSRKHVAGYNSSAEWFAHYNEFASARQLLESNGVAADKIVSVDVDTHGFPSGTKFDVIISLLAWGFHFPVETYLEEAHGALAPGGCLVLDLRRGTDGRRKVERLFGPATVVHEDEKVQRVVVQR